MLLKSRIEFPGAVDHMLDRGDRREPIVRSDKGFMRGLNGDHFFGLTLVSLVCFS